MKHSNLLAVDLAKNVFQICSLDKHQTVQFNRQLKRSQLAAFMAKQPPAKVAMEACYTSHYWARAFTEMGHDVVLIPAQHVKPFVRGNKSDHNDAVAIAEAAQRPNLKSVPIKTIEQQDIQCLHRIRERLVSQRTALMNQARGLLAEYGVISPQGHRAFVRSLHEISAADEQRISTVIKAELRLVADEYYAMCEHIEGLENKLQCLAKRNIYCQQLLTIPGIGLINATAIVSAIGRGDQFKNAREFAVWLGLTPRQASSGDKLRSMGITKRGNRYLRKQLVHGARAAVTRCKKKDDALSRWANALVQRRGAQKAYVAYAARIARLAWILLQRNESYRAMA